jgi:hypothetical protein
VAIFEKELLTPVMKKIFVILIIIAALVIITSYVIIPSTLKINAVAESNMNFKAVGRHLTDVQNWPKWWPGAKKYTLKDIDFRLDKIKLNSFELQLFFKTDSIKNYLQLVPLDSNKTAFSWGCEFESSKNPFKRWQQYFDAVNIKKTLQELIDSLRNYSDKAENVYGFRVEKVKVADSVLISTRNVFTHYPGEKEIDSMIQQLRNYISSQKAIEKNYPMLNVHQNGTNDYEAMAAIATERLLPATKNFSPKLVLKGGNILEAEFRGGPEAVKKAFSEFENYRADYNITSPAIPYQLLVTDRIKEADTTKWVTKFYYPIF